ncbi:MAG: AEC family transporter [Candidatus Cloacimonetes bacterium]|nr:AEC family transporter [Candidatus Cloacimonadota bacterium]
MNTQNVILVLSFALGIALKSLKLLSKDDAPVLLRFVLNVCLPPVMILAIYRATLSLDMLLVPLSAMLVVVILYFISSFVGGKLKMPRKTFGSFLIGTMIMNTAFALPYFKAIGSEELARASLFDIGNSILIFTFSYYNAIKYGSKPSGGIQWKKFLSLAPLWAMVIALGIKALSLKIPVTLVSFLEVLGQPVGVLMMVALGLAFSPRMQDFGKAFVAVFIRMGLGFAAGLGLAYLFGLQGIARTVVITGSALPVGFNTLILAEREGLDGGFAATMVSISTLIALFTTPLLIRFF